MAKGPLASLNDIPCGPLMKKGMWVFDGAEEFGKVTKVFVLDKDDYMNIDIYDRNGNRLRSEKSLEQSQWQRIEKPVFPLPKMAYLDEVLELIE